MKQDDKAHLVGESGTPLNRDDIVAAVKDVRAADTLSVAVDLAIAYLVKPPRAALLQGEEGSSGVSPSGEGKD